MKKYFSLFFVLIFIISIFSFKVEKVSAGWIERTIDGSPNWQAITSSSDGTKLAAVSYGFSFDTFTYSKEIYISNDSGLTWIGPNTIISNMEEDPITSITSSSDGTKLALALSGNYIYTSSDGGITWVPQSSSGALDWRSITSSSDGTKLAVVAYNGYIYTSPDSGLNWNQETLAGSKIWTFITSSSDGTKLAAIVATGMQAGIYVYSGGTWVRRTGVSTPRSVAYSPDGTKIFAVNAFGGFYTSTNDGVTWTGPTIINADANLKQIISYSDGQKLAVIDMGVLSGGYIYTSSDSGLNWNQETSAGLRAWRSISSFNDTNLATIATNNSYIYTYAPDNLAPSSTTPTISGTPNISEILTGSYTYSDDESDPEGTSTYRWLRDDTAIEGATSLTYTTVQDDIGHTLKLEVTPVASTGTTPGTTVTSEGLDIVAIAPTIITPTSINITKNSITLNSEITSDGGDTITTSGFKYGLTTTYTDITTDGPTTTGTYSKEITGLKCNTTYHYVAYATNGAGTTETDDQSFTTSKCPTSSGSRVTTPYAPPTVITPPNITIPTITTPTNINTITRNLKLTPRRTIGDDVKVLQEYLNSHNYNCGIADGILGTKTNLAIIAFQKANNLKPDGIVGPLTREKMR